MKVYLVRQGDFGTDWEINPDRVFRTKKALHQYMKEVNGCGCYRSKNPAYHEDEEIYENQTEQVGYEIIESKLL